MPEWTLCADLKVYARLQSPAKPATHRAAPPPVDHDLTDQRVVNDTTDGPEARGVRPGPAR